MFEDETLDFEDVFNIVTPGGIDRRIIDLDAAFQQLKAEANGNAYVLSEVRAWEIWSKKVLDSWTSKVFATGLLQELDSWKKRYATAYQKIGSKIAPVPDVFNEDNSILTSPIFWIAVTTIVGTGLYFYVTKYKK
jgi:hypothetical protein